MADVPPLTNHLSLDGDPTLQVLANQLLLSQALERLFFPKEPLEELRRCANTLRNHAVHSGARIPAIQAVALGAQFFLDEGWVR